MDKIKVKREVDLTNLPETLLTLKELDPYLDKNGQGMAFEEGNHLMIIVVSKYKLMKKRVNKKYFKGDIDVSDIGVTH